jgi:adenine deaminase
MSCSITSGLTLGCKDSQGGLEYLYIADLPTYDTITTNAGGEIVSLDASGTPVTITFYKYEVPKQSSSFTETINADNTAGTVFYQQDALMVFNKMESVKRDQIKLLAQNPKLLVVIKDGNSKFWSVGVTRGAELTAGSVATGVAYGDRNGGEITLTGLEPDPSYECTAAFVGE